MKALLMLLLAVPAFASTADTPVSIATLPLPSGAATGAKQDTGNSSLSSIDSKLTNPLPTSLASVPTHAVTQSGVWTIVFTTGSFSNPIYVLSTGTYITGSGGALNIVSTSVVITGSLPAGNNNIGDIDVLTLPALTAGTNRIGGVRLVDSADADLTAAIGSQVSRPVGIQEQKDAGRTIFVASGTAVAGVTSEAVVSLSTSAGLGVAAGPAVSSIAVPNGKRTRINMLCAAWRNSTAATGGAIVRLRAMSSGTCAVTSPVLFTVATGTTTVIAGGNIGGCTPIPEGIEFAGANTFCLSQLAINTNTGLELSLLGFNY